MVEVTYVVKPSTVGWVERTSSFGVRGKEFDKLHQSPSDRRTNGIVRCDQLFISYKKANERKGDDKSSFGHDGYKRLDDGMRTRGQDGSVSFPKADTAAADQTSTAKRAPRQCNACFSKRSTSVSDRVCSGKVCRQNLVQNDTHVVRSCVAAA